MPAAVIDGARDMGLFGPKVKELRRFLRMAAP